MSCGMEDGMCGGIVYMEDRIYVGKKDGMHCGIQRLHRGSMDDGIIQKHFQFSIECHIPYFIPP